MSNFQCFICCQKLHIFSISFWNFAANFDQIQFKVVKPSVWFRKYFKLIKKCISLISIFSKGRMNSSKIIFRSNGFISFVIYIRITIVGLFFFYKTRNKNNSFVVAHYIFKFIINNNSPYKNKLFFLYCQRTWHELTYSLTNRNCVT